MKKIAEGVFMECLETLSAGQREYAQEANALSAFEDLARDLGLDRKYVLWVLAKKHVDGIASYIKGHKSQRESVKGRINDLICYMCFLRAMVEDDEVNLP